MNERMFVFTRILVVATVSIMLVGCSASPEPGRDARGANGAVTAGHPLAAEAGLKVLQEGGNAMDAAITMASVLAVARPHMNGIGGDTFILYFDAQSGRVYALNGSGRSGSRATVAAVREAGHEQMPEIGPMSVSVPGAVGAWAAALERFGTLAWSEALDPAVTLARNGLPVSERLALDITAEIEKLENNDEAARIYLPGGRVPNAGALLKQDELAATLAAIQAEGPEAFYWGETARKLAGHIQPLGGFLTLDDFKAYEPEWVEALSANYHGLDVYVQPPNTQGEMLLAMLQLLSNFDVEKAGRGTSDYYHLLAEAIRVAAAERDANVADPRFMKVSVAELTDPERLAALASMFDPKGNAPTQATEGKDDDHPNTVAVMAVDKDGNAVSLIQSLFHSFGSGIVVPGTGVVLHNRGSLFRLDAGHPNMLGPRRRPYHTLCPAMVLRDGKPWLAFGTPGGDGQTHTLTQVLHNILFFGMTPQEAIDAPRMRRYAAQNRLAIEDRASDRSLRELSERGYRVVVRQGWTAEFGGAQAILIDPETGELRAGADRRREAWALAY